MTLIYVIRKLLFRTGQGQGLKQETGILTESGSSKVPIYKKNQVGPSVSQEAETPFCLDRMLTSCLKYPLEFSQ